MSRNLAKQTVSILALLILLGVVGFGLRYVFPNVSNEALVGETPLGTTSESAVLSKSLPIALRIPKINVDTSFVTLGVDENREIEIPTGYEEVGWYRHGPTPGELGPAVVLGHVDSKRGPAVFYSLGQLSPGDKIEVDREDGVTAVFEVKTLERYSRSNFPTTLVYGDIDHAGLRLITCSGSYDRQQKQYDYNLIVYAELVE